MNVNEREKELSRITGFLNAEFSEPMPGGKWKHGLTKQGYEMVLAGYACGHCLAIFDRFTLVCPACQTWHDIGAAPMETPQHWLDHLAERYAPVPYDKPVVKNPFMANDTSFMERMRNNPDVEHIDLTEQTKKRKRGK